jgi:hypothetical protein
MQRTSIGSAFVTVGVIAAVAGPRPAPPGSSVSAVVADTTDVVTAPWWIG